MSMLSKTDFIQYMNCPKSLWLLNNRPADYPHGEFSDLAKKLAAEGYMVEEQVRLLVATYDNASAYSFQEVFETDEGMFARADMVLENEDGSIDLFEIKSSTSVDDRAPHNQLKDAAFQTIAAMRCGKTVRNIFIVHLDGDYVRTGTVEPEKLLVSADETIRVKALIGETESEIAEALALLDQDEIDESSCTCLHLSRANQCDSFDYFNPGIPKPSIYTLTRLSAKKRDTFVSEGRFSLDEIDVGEVIRLQQPVLQSHLNGAPYIDIADIENFMSVVRYPLYFLDYETYASAIPVIDGIGPHGQFPFQFSLHVQQQDGTLIHHEYLADEAALPLRLIEALEDAMGPDGSVVVWNKGFENSQNKKMAELYPEKAPFLLGLVERTIDLMDVFKTGYVDIAFGGSTSIKKVLPVVAPELSYDGMPVADGCAAMDAWKKMLDETDANQRAKSRQALLDYCELDSLAMVKLFEFAERQMHQAST